MGHLIGQILPLALGAAISPTVLIFILLVLSEHERPVAKAFAFLLGATAVIAAIGILVLAVGQQLGSGSPAKQSSTSAIVDIVLGVLLLALAARSVRHKHAPADPRHKHGTGGKLATRMRTAGPALYLLIGAADMAINVSTLVLYFDALKQIARSHVAVADQVAAAAFVAFFCLLPILLPLALTVAMPHRSKALLARLNTWVGHNSRRLGVGILVVFGAYLTIKGARAL